MRDSTRKSLNEAKEKLKAGGVTLQDEGFVYHSTRTWVAFTVTNDIVVFTITKGTEYSLRLYQDTLSVDVHGTAWANTDAENADEDRQERKKKKKKKKRDEEKGSPRLKQKASRVAPDDDEDD